MGSIEFSPEEAAKLFTFPPPNTDSLPEFRKNRALLDVNGRSTKDGYTTNVALKFDEVYNFAVTGGSGSRIGRLATFPLK
jgi:hypothetical protein